MSRWRVDSLHRPRAVLAFVAAATLVFALSCGGGDGSAEPPDRSIEVTMSDLAFEPREITMERGERIELRLANRGTMEHDFTVDQMPLTSAIRMAGGMPGREHAGHRGGGAALHMALSVDDAGSFTFEPTDAGRFDYYCTVEGHREAGMFGTLVVE